MELDHFFIFTSINAPEIDCLLDIGLTEGKSNTHLGQGTANRRIFFNNFMLEFLWVVEEKEVCSPLIAPTHLWERWRYLETGYSPFGIGFTRSTENEKLPFATWDYRPPYLPSPLKIDVANNINPKEPFLFVIPFKKSDRERSFNHPNRIKEITNIKITIPTNKPFSQAINTIQETGLVTFCKGKEHLVEIECDRGIQKQTHDCRSSLPLILWWEK